MQTVSGRRVGGRWARILLSYGIGAAGLYWVFHDVPLREVLGSIRRTNWLWLVPSVFLQLLVYVCAGWEWQILLRTTGRVSVLRASQAVFAGRFANDVMPVHLGYVVRVFLLSRWMRLGMAALVPSLLVERLFDGLWLAAGIGLIALSFPLPPGIGRTAAIWTGIVGFGFVALAAIIIRKPTNPSEASQGLSQPGAWGNLRKWLALLDQVRRMARSWSFVWALGVSLLKAVCQGLAFLMVLWAYGFELPVRVQIAVFMIAYVGISIPSTPASVGVFQFFCVAGLRLFGVAKAAASGFGLLAFLVLTVPLSVAGFAAFAQSGVTLTQVRRQVNPPGRT